jgi:signal transduction histidine kinase
MPKSLMQSVVSQLQLERARLERELHGVSAALAAFGKVYAHGGAATGKGRRRISAAGRARIAAAQRKRWAKIRAVKKSK